MKAFQRKLAKSKSKINYRHRWVAEEISINIFECIYNETFEGTLEKYDEEVSKGIPKRIAGGVS